MKDLDVRMFDIPTPPGLALGFPFLARTDPEVVAGRQRLMLLVHELDQGPTTVRVHAVLAGYGLSYNGQQAVWDNGHYVFDLWRDGKATRRHFRTRDEVAGMLATLGLLS